MITRQDVTAVASRQESVEGAGGRGLSVPASAEVAAETRIPIKGVRKATAQAMVSSAFTAPHVSEWVTCDVSATMELLDRLKARREFADLRISPLLIMAKAVCLALRRTPELNSTWDEAAQEIVVKHSVNLGIAAATPRGLVVPNIKGAERPRSGGPGHGDQRPGGPGPRGSGPAGRPVRRARSRSPTSGCSGSTRGTPILNPGEAGILCVGQVARRPWVVGTGADERIEPRWVTTLAISFDHRLADGAQGSTFLADVAAILADPGLALLY